MYELKIATKEDRERLRKYKSELSYTNIEEKIKDKKVKKDINSTYKKYKMILVDDKKIGCLLLENNQIDEIYIESDYRNQNIGTEIIKNIINSNKETYLWTFKSNRKAINLYKKLGFKIIRETDISYYMRRCKYEFN